MIESARIEGLTVLANRGIQSIELNAEQAIQLIIGHNGSGKSSLLRELNCMPARPANYAVGGSKVIVQNYNGHRYVFTSNIRKQGAFHTITKDGEVLCENVNGTHQASVIAHELGISKQVLKVLYREYKFTQLDPGALEKLLPEMLNIDLEQAFDVYKRTRQTKRDNAGVIKHLRQKLDGSAAEIQALKGIEDAQIQLDADLAYLDQLRSKTRPRDHRVDPLSDMRRTNNVLAEMVDMVDSVKRMGRIAEAKYRTIDRPLSYGEATATKSLLLMRRKDNRDRHAQVSSELVEANRLMSVLENTEGGSERLERECEEISAKLERVNWTGSEPYVGHFDAAIGQCHEALSSLDEWLEQPSETYEFNTRESFQELQTAIENNRQHKRKVANDIAQLESQLSNQTRALAEQVKCPNCNTTICAEGEHQVTPEDVEKTKGFLKNANILIETIDASYEENLKVLDRYRQYQKRITGLRAIVAKAHHLQTFWQQYKNAGVLGESLQRASNDLRRLLGQLEDWSIGVTLTADLEARRNTLELFRAASSGNVVNRHKTLTNTLGELDRELDDITYDYNLLSREIEHFDKLAEVSNGLMAAKEQAGVHYSDWLRNTLSEMVETEYDQVQMRMAEVKRKVDHYASLKAQQASYDEDLSYSLQVKDDLDYLERFISPRQGIIGQRLKTCIQGLCDQINEILSHLWTEPLEILPCFNEQGTVDYRFKMLVNGSKVDRLPELSQGERDVLDLAFILSIYQLNQFQCYPLYVDEVGSSFDYAHRQKLMQYIGQLVEMRGYEQVFIINHYAGEYGGLTSMDVLALSENNVVLPERYNHHVNITYG